MAVESYAEPMIIVGWCTLALAAMVIGLRLWTRLVYLRQKMFLYDWCMVVGLLFQVLATGVTTGSYVHGLGRHIKTISVPQLGYLVQLSLILESFELLSAMLGRLSFTLFLLAIIGTANKHVRRQCYAVIAINVLVNLGAIIALTVQCGHHLDALWDTEHPELRVKYCAGGKPYYQAYVAFIQGVACAICDLWLTILPIAILWPLQMPHKERNALLAVLTLSSFAFIASVIRLAYTRGVAASDSTWWEAIYEICAFVETNVVFIAASLPCLRPLWTKKADKSAQGNKSSFSTSRSYSTKRSKSERRHMDAASEEHILGHRPSGSISCQTAVQVESHAMPELKYERWQPLPVYPPPTHQTEIGAAI